jgi:signal transduction histidine kinase
MTKTYRSRFVFLVAALAVMAALSLGVVQQSWKRFNSLEHRLTSGLLESFRLADDFQARLQRLNNNMLRFTARREPSALTEFQQASDALNHWIDQHDPQMNKESNLITEQERKLFSQINEAYDDYLRSANIVLSNRQPAIVTAEAFAQLDQFELQSQRLLTLGGQLADAHRQAQESFLGESRRALGVLRGFMIASIIVMIVLVGALGVVIYRDLIAPLRVRLVQSEALLERQEKLATLGTLAAGIAHEIRNPLTSIKARLYTLGKHIKGNQAGLTDTNVISDEIARLERIVQDVLSFARPSEPQRVRVHADTPLLEVHSLMAGTLEKSGVRLVLEPAEKIIVSMDVALIKQVLINLIRNAAESIEGGGTITLRVRADRVALHGAERAVAILEVADTGKGIPPEIEKRLFDPFFTTKEAGTGLGLSIAMRTVEKNGGLLQYQTQVGRGTTFGIVLSSVAPEPGDKSPASQNA